MSKNFLLVSLLIFCTGLLLGYAGDYFTRSGTENSSSAGENVRSVRRFGDAPKESQTPLSTAGKSNKSKTSPLKELDQNILRIAKIGVEEIQAEIDRIRKKPGYPNGLKAIDKISLAILYSRLGQKIPLQALEKIERNPEYKFRCKKYILTAWAMRNPEAAMNYCLSDKNSFDLLGYARIIGKNSPDAALEWIKGLPEGKESAAQHGLLMEMSRSYPERLGEIIPKLGKFSEYSNVHAMAANYWVKVDREAALKWISTLPEKQKNEAMAQALSVLPLEESTREVSALTGEAKEAAISRIALSLSYKSEEQAIEWIMKNADPDPESLRRITNSLYNFDYFKPSLQEYLTKMPAGELKDQLLMRTVQQTQNTRWNDGILRDMTAEESLAIAAKVGNPEKREKLVDDFLQNWIYRDPAEVRQWLDKSDMPQEKKKKFYETCDRFLKAENE